MDNDGISNLQHNYLASSTATHLGRKGFGVLKLLKHTGITSLRC